MAAEQEIVEQLNLMAIIERNQDPRGLILVKCAFADRNSGGYHEDCLVLTDLINYTDVELDKCICDCCASVCRDPVKCSFCLTLRCRLCVHKTNAPEYNNDKGRCLCTHRRNSQNCFYIELTHFEKEIFRAYTVRCWHCNTFHQFDEIAFHMQDCQARKCVNCNLYYGNYEEIHNCFQELKDFVSFQHTYYSRNLREMNEFMENQTTRANRMRNELLATSIQNENLSLQVNTLNQLLRTLERQIEESRLRIEAVDQQIRLITSHLPEQPDID